MYAELQGHEPEPESCCFLRSACWKAELVNPMWGEDDILGGELLVLLEERLLEGRAGDFNVLSGVKLMWMDFTTLLLYKYSLKLDSQDYK